MAEAEKYKNAGPSDYEGIAERSKDPSFREALIRPTINLGTLLWTALLGIPGVLIFLILEKNHGL